MANNATSSINFYAGGRMLTSEYSESVNSNALRTDMTGGYAKQAKRASKQVKVCEATYFYTAAEFEAFKTWFKDTAADGVLFFNWNDPVSGNTIDARIVNGVYNAKPMNARMKHWNVVLQIESYT